MFLPSVAPFFRSQRRRRERLPLAAAARTLLGANDARPTAVTVENLTIEC